MLALPNWKIPTTTIKIGWSAEKKKGRLTNYVIESINTKSGHLGQQAFRLPVGAGAGMRSSLGFYPVAACCSVSIPQVSGRLLGIFFVYNILPRTAQHYSRDSRPVGAVYRVGGKRWSSVVVCFLYTTLLPIQAETVNGI